MAAVEHNYIAEDLPRLAARCQFNGCRCKVRITLRAKIRVRRDDSNKKELHLVGFCSSQHAHKWAKGE